jgi:hypothetical protein
LLDSELVYENTRRAFAARGIDYVDARAMLSAPGVPRELLWAPQARHWSDYGACLALQAIGVTASRQRDRPLDIACAYKAGRHRRSHDDFDLLRLLNVWRPRHTKQNAIVTYPSPPAGPKSRIIFIATSFGWQLLRAAEASGHFRELFLDYYDETLYRLPGTFEATHLAVDSADWRDAFLDQDIYVYELFESYAYSDVKFVRILDNLLAHIPP